MMNSMSKGFERGRLGCGCIIRFRDGVEGSPVTVVIAEKGAGCPLPSHVAGLAVYDHREALRPPNRIVPITESDYEEEG